MHTHHEIAARMRQDDLDDLFAYRYEVFVERLKWDLPAATHKREIDQFDRPDTIHILARDKEDTLCGCSRLLPTTSPYLLESVFPELMHGDAPNADDVWEISRFSSVPVRSATQACGRQIDMWGCREVMAATVTAAMEVGARRLIGVSVLAIERILMRLGVNAYRAGPAMLLHGHYVFAFCLEIDQQTLEALHLDGEKIGRSYVNLS